MAATTCSWAVNWEFRTPEHFDTAIRPGRPEDVTETILTSCSLDKPVGWVGRYRELGLDEVCIHKGNRNQEAFLEAFLAKVRPQLR